MPSKVDLCNSALRKIGESAIIALDNNTLWGQRCNSALPEIIDDVLRMDFWRCCIGRAQIPKLSQEPIGEFNAEYPLPADCIRVAAIKINRYNQWSIEQNSILCNVESPLEIMYVKRIDDPNVYTAELYQLMAMRLAVELMPYATTSSQRKGELYEIYMAKQIQAININSHDNPVNRLDETTWIDARYSNIDRGWEYDSPYQ